MSLDLDTLRAVATRLFDALPPDEIGAIYCDEGGEAFFRETAPRIVQLGAHLAEGLLARLDVARPAAGTMSLYVGSGIAEVPMMLAEVLGRGRRVVACNLRERECDLLRAALRRADGVDADAITLLAGEAGALVGAMDGASFSHVSMISVFTDPETYPQISGLTYGRLPPVLLDADAFECERRAIRETLDTVLGAVDLPGLVTTTGEEGPWIFDWAERSRTGGGRPIDVDVEDVAYEAPVVGDAVGFLRLAEVEVGT